MHRQVPDPGKSQLNAGPWKNLDKKRREERDKKRARFNAYGRGWDAFFAEKPCEPPTTFNTGEAAEWRKGYLAACTEKAQREQTLAEIRGL